MKDIAIYGAGGLGHEIAALITCINKKKLQWNLIGFFDDNLSAGKNNPYGKRLGGINELNHVEKSLSIVIAIGNPESVAKIVEKISNPNIDFPNIIAPDFLCLDPDSFIIGKGNIITSRCIVTCNFKMGNFNFFNMGVIIGHDVTIDSFNTIMPYVNISGNVQIGYKNLFGVKSTILQNIKIGNQVKISSGSTIIRNTKDNSLYLGNPAIKINL